jgi:hypothetical protein
MKMRRGLAWVAAAIALLAVFAAYRRPDFIGTLANQIWACF